MRNPLALSTRSALAIPKQLRKINPPAGLFSAAQIGTVEAFAPIPIPRSKRQTKHCCHVCANALPITGHRQKFADTKMAPRLPNQLLRGSAAQHPTNADPIYGAAWFGSQNKIAFSELGYEDLRRRLQEEYVERRKRTFIRPSRQESRALLGSPMPRAVGNFRLAPLEPDNLNQQQNPVLRNSDFGMVLSENNLWNSSHLFDPNLVQLLPQSIISQSYFYSVSWLGLCRYI